MLALRSRGLGSSLAMIHLGGEPEVARLLDIPEEMSQAGLIPVADLRDSRPSGVTRLWCRIVARCLRLG